MNFQKFKVLPPLLTACFLCLSCVHDEAQKTPAVNAVVEKISATREEISIQFSHDEMDLELFDSSAIQIMPFPSSGFGYEISSPSPGLLKLNLNEPLSYYTKYKVTVSSGRNLGLRILDSFSYSFTTPYDETPRFERIPVEDLLTLVQRQTFRYFWDYAHPDSGLARERLGSGDTVTSGGSGFGLCAIPAAVLRGFVSREEAAERVLKIVDFLDSKAERFHGAYSHWFDGRTGKAIAFSSNDNGGDLVETAFLVEGLLVLRSFFDGQNEMEVLIRQKITSIWESVEWDWYLNGQNALFWHWSPDKGWAMNMKITGWNEGLIVYVLAASSPTHPISKAAYDEGWARGGAIRNGGKIYDTVLPLGSNSPLFFAHYSFLGLDPRNLRDAYASYWQQNVAHSSINRAHCIANPKGYFGYSSRCWGLTASDYPKGYTASSPLNDTGTIAPTAALSSMPYTPEASLEALEYFYYVLGDKLWGEYGFKDAFNLDSHWFAKSYIAIDQGPIIAMIENYRTGLIWSLFMKNPEILSGLTLLGFTY